MSASIKDLQNELAALEAQLGQIDVPALQKIHDQAVSDKNAYTPARNLAFDPFERELTQAAGAASQSLENAKYKHRDLERRIRPLAAMLEAPVRLQEAQDDVIALTERVATAAAVVATAGDTVTSLTTLLGELQAARETHVQTGAQAVLAGVKMSQHVAVAAFDTAQMVTVEYALTLAQTELDQAIAQHEAEQSDLDAANRKFADAQTESAALIFELQIRDFVASVEQYQAAGGEFDPDDLEMRIAVAKQEHGVEPVAVWRTQQLASIHDPDRQTAPQYAIDHMNAGAFRGRGCR